MLIASRLIIFTYIFAEKPEHLLLNSFPARGIGIGRSLAAPLLPHHRAYGSRTTAVRQIQSRMVALIQARDSEYVEIATGKCKGKRRTSAQPPWSMR
jgi:hypothetical protein